MAIWDDLISPEDRKAYEKYRTITNIGFGKRPAIIVVDMTYSFVDDRFSTGCSKAGRPCIENIAKLIKQARLNIRLSTQNQSALHFHNGLGSGVNLNHQRCQPADPGKLSERPQDMSKICNIKRSPQRFFGTNLVSYLNYYMVIL